MDVDSRKFIELSATAVRNESLKTSMGLLGAGLSMRRAQAKAGLAEFDALRDEARDIKNDVLANLDAYLEAFEAQVTRQGGVVHWASTDEEARDAILAICRDADARTVTKSKSMVTEEIELVPHLEAHGITAVETDLGEYIIQLRRERPSHIIAPAIHLNKDEVSETFFEHHRKLGYNERLTERADLVGEARHVLRDKFLGADVGISGANFLIAESGTVVLVTNEGNAELTTSLPKTHIVVTGIEKVVPTFEDAATFIRLLGRSAAGMEISQYTSFITGPAREGDADGPRNFHVVLVDNGRSRMIGTEFQDMLRCIRCSACLNHCPVYLSVGGHAYGSVYNGPMGAVLTPGLSSIGDAGHLPNASTFCGKCEEVCPVRIPLPRMMRAWRNRESEAKLNPVGMRWGLRGWQWLATHPRLYRLATRLGIGVLRRIARGDSSYLSHMPLAAGNWTRDRDFPTPSPTSFVAQWEDKL
ncbi:MAG: iron-sulfur cluster-binding protein [Pseudomonadales bacterium]|nr:iron-sulfur cluster-binding protein [Pseudomonadales bacterium]